ncbi:MAG: pentapeptide repeat-containing protein [Nostoc sp. ChiSLP02]|nr:pentapeptide repeat-containing protein [Nostoc sp. DedSLP05]MDZ8099910.1 pentapeptide repeat-containing protein [Nostoc sp. DedSLP01]MDZ8189713.1 pentapeptide repeat-containing protein [Nostoc sp. ChiSLP02]
MPPDYSGQNLRGCSFKGQNLTGANFRNTDIRGANFSNTILKEADFRGARAGLQQRWVILLLATSLFISAISGLISAYSGLWLVYLLYGDSAKLHGILPGCLVLILYAMFAIFSFPQGLTVGLGVFIGVFALAVAIAGAMFMSLNNGIWVAIAFYGCSFGFLGIPFIVALAVVNNRVVIDTPFIDIGLAIVGSICGTIIGAFILGNNGRIEGSIAMVTVGLLLGCYMARLALIGRENYTSLKMSAVAFAATGGTSFRNADLTNADFTGATLKNTDFRKTDLTRTRFYETKKLDFARVGGSILGNRDILNLLVTANGIGKSYFGANLKGANLIGADLKEANLKHADISEATFEQACLEWANLTRTQAVVTNFTNARMTGACVEAWNIESTTKLDNVDCRFVYLLENPKPGTDDRERRPNSGEFKPGEFTKLFEEVLNTVDLIFRNGIDWRAFVSAFKQVQVENEDTELAIQSIENKGDGVIVVRVAVPVDADKEKIHSSFTQNYQLALQAVEEKYKAQLQAKDEQIVIYRQQSGEMAEIVRLLANKPINVQIDNTVENKNMSNSNDSSRNINVGRDFNATGTINLGKISGAVTNTINELPPSTEPEKPGIKELLTQLQVAIEADTNLSKEDKAEALEQVKALAEAGKNSQEGGMQKAAKTAIKILKGTIAGLPSATKLVEECSKLLPLISNFLGLG